MLGTLRKAPDHVQALQRVKDWARERLELAADDVILVSEVNCTYPGCVPLETLVVFWTDGDTHHHFKVFKPVAEVVYDDLPPADLKPWLVTDEEFGCSCC